MQVTVNCGLQRVPCGLPGIAGKTGGSRPSGHRKPKPARRGGRIDRRPGGPGNDMRSRRDGGNSRVERRRTIPARAVGLSLAGCACAVRPLRRDNAMCREAHWQGGCGKGGDLKNGQPFDNLHPAHSCRSHSFNRARVGLFADEGFMMR